jgi:8-hydroxy-5-deazaflavin:NADPH oxidoreductase
VFGSRDPASKTLDFPVRGLAEAVAQSDTVVNATRGSASLDTLSAIGPDLFAGKTLIDVANAFGRRCAIRSVRW